MQKIQNFNCYFIIFFTLLPILCTGKISPDPLLGKLWILPSIFLELGKNIPIHQGIYGNQFPISGNCAGYLTQLFFSQSPQYGYGNTVFNTTNDRYSCSEVQTQSPGSFSKKVALKIFFKIHNTCARVSFLIKLQARSLFSKKRFWHRCFPVNFANFVRTPFLQNTPVGCFCLFYKNSVL